MKRGRVERFARTAGMVLCVGLAVEESAALGWGFYPWGTLDPASGWSIAAGDFAGAGRADVVAYHPNDGTVWVGTNLGSSFSFALWATLTPAAGWSIAAGDFAGNGRSDVVAYHPKDGTVWVGTNLGSSFSFALWTTLTPAAGWSIAAGDFAGNGRSDVVAYHPKDGTVWVGTNLGSSFGFALWATLTPAAGWSIAAGDFAGNARSDVVAHHPNDGTVWVGVNLGTSFDFGLWAVLTPEVGWSIAAADVCGVTGGCLYTGDGLDDLVAYHNSGTVWAGRNSASSFVFTTVGDVAPASGWFLAGGYFWGDDVAGAVFYHPSDGSIWVSSPSPEGYAWPVSAAPGEQIDFMVSGIGTHAFYRHTSVGVGVTSVPMAPPAWTFDVQPLPAQPWMSGCGWLPSFSLVVPAGWPSGIYSARLTGAVGEESHVTFVVKPDPGQPSRVALLANTNTWLAYNEWGGESKYTEPDPPIVSYLRPDPDASPVAAGFGPEHLTRAELWIFGFLDAEGHSPHVYTDMDMHEGSFLDAYEVLVVGTHPEYWTVEMYDNLKAFLAQGGSLLYLGGNGLFEAAEYTSGGTAMSFLNGNANTPRADLSFRNLSPPRPERSLLGMTTERCGASGQPFEVLQPDHWLFTGTGLMAGDFIGNFGLNTGGGRFNGKASAHEVDTISGPGATSPAPCGLSPPTTPPPPPGPLPPGLTLIARALTSPDDVEPGELGADMTFYRHKGGGFVLSAGSITFGGSLAVEPYLQQVIRNALAADIDGDGVAPVEDCNEANPAVWATPGEVLDLVLAEHQSPGETTLSWSAPAEPGGSSLGYDTLRSLISWDFGEAARCLGVSGVATTAVDMEIPPPGAVFFYLVRATNVCPYGVGTLGSDSLGSEREGRLCPV